MEKEEVVAYKDKEIVVTNARISCGNTDYPLHHIVGVGIQSSPEVKGAFVLFLVGTGIGLIGFCLIMLFLFRKDESLFVLMCMLGAILSLTGISQMLRKKEYFLIIESLAGMAPILRNNDFEHLLKIKEVIAKEIIEIGNN